MEVTRFSVKGKHDLSLKGIMVKPKKDPKAIVQIFHGMGEYKDRYLPFMEFLAENGFVVYAHDHRKHGESITEENGYGIWTKEDRFSDVIDDCNFVTRKILRDYPGKKLIIFGHSMGSIIARNYISRYALVPAAAIIMGTIPPYTKAKGFAPIALAKTIRLFKKAGKRTDFMAETMNKPCIKEIENPRTNLDWLSRDEAVVDAYIADPLCGYAYTPQFYVEFIKTIVNVSQGSVISLTKDMPLLFISGDHDPVGEMGVGIEEVVRHYKGYGYTQITKKLVEGARHEILNETNKEETYQFILDWLIKAI
jgi:alpha-beta hydrolase superfamily lysophospholipase